MCVDISHLVLEALRDADNEVVDEGLDCAKCRHTLASAVVQFDIDNVAGWVREANGQMCHVLHKFPWSVSIAARMRLRQQVYLLDPPP